MSRVIFRETRRKRYLFLLPLILIGFLLITNDKWALAYIYPTTLHKVILDNMHQVSIGHEDRIVHDCKGNFAASRHEIYDFYNETTSVPYTGSDFYETICARDTELIEETIFSTSCETSTNTSSSDTGLQCDSVTDVGYITLYSGFIRNDDCNPSCADCSAPPPAGGFRTRDQETSLTLILDCKKPYIGKLLHIETGVYPPWNSGSAYVMSEILPNGSEILINGIAPYSIQQLYFSPDLCSGDAPFFWGGELKWDIPINTVCGEKITLIPSVQNGWGRAGIDRIALISIGGIEIIKPANNYDFDLTQSNHTATDPINYNAHVEPVGGASTVDWNVALTYRTSGGKCAGCDVTRTFQSAPDMDHSETYTSMGGQATVNASAVIQGETMTATPVVHTITGVAIPDAEITNRLVSLYRGPSSGLMAGLAMKESSYMQFTEVYLAGPNRGQPVILYGRNDKWPNESYDGGSHIGLMMIDMAREPIKERAWNWLNNTDYGVKFFSGEKRSMALNWEKKIKTEARTLYNCQLRNLTEVERENMTLVLYGEGAMNALTGQYYYYQATTNKGKTTCDWIENTQGNETGVKYAKAVRTFCNQKVPGSC